MLSNQAPNTKKSTCKKQVLFSTKFALRASEIALLWNICFANVKYSLARMWANFISHCDEGAIFHNFRKKIISHSASPNISLNSRVAFCTANHNGATILHPNTKVLDFQGLFVFLGMKTNILQHCTFSPTFWTWTCDLF